MSQRRRTTRVIPSCTVLQWMVFVWELTSAAVVDLHYMRYLRAKEQLHRCTGAMQLPKETILSGLAAPRRRRRRLFNAFEIRQPKHLTYVTHPPPPRTCQYPSTCQVISTRLCPPPPPLHSRLSLSVVLWSYLRARNCPPFHSPFRVPRNPLINPLPCSRESINEHETMNPV